MKRNLRNMVELKEFLKNPSPKLKVPVYTENKDEDEPVKHSTNKNTLSQRMDKLERTLIQIVELMKDGFKRLDSKMDTGFKQANTRLDYIVKANDLKDLPRNK